MTTSDRPLMKRETLKLIRQPELTPAIRRLEFESDWHFAARCRSIRLLGSRWVKHPAYTFQPRHSNSPELSQQGRAQYLAQIALAAHADRARNPAFQRAERFRAAADAP